MAKRKMKVKKPKIYKCKYSHCKHKSKDITETDEFVKVGKSAYYHVDCYKEKEAIEKIIDVFANEVNENVVFPKLRRVINDIVYNRGNSAEYLLFGLRYFIDNKQINYPGGLYYILQNKDVAIAWDKQKLKKINSELTNSFIVEDDDIDKDNNIILSTQKSNFDTILGE